MTCARERARRFLIRALSRIHARAYRISGGRILGSLVGMPVLLLTTTGRESGKPRTATLTYLRDGPDLVVIGSFGGSELPPARWLTSSASAATIRWSAPLRPLVGLVRLSFVFTASPSGSLGVIRGHFAPAFRPSDSRRARELVRFDCIDLAVVSALTRLKRKRKGHTQA